MEKGFLSESHLAGEVAKNTGYLKSDVIKIVRKYHRIALQKLLEGMPIRFTYIGILKVYKTKPYVGWDAFNGWDMICPPITRIKFTPIGPLHREIRKNDKRKAFPLHQGPPEGYDLDFELPTRKERKGFTRGDGRNKVRTVWSRDGKSRKIFTR